MGVNSPGTAASGELLAWAIFIFIQSSLIAGTTPQPPTLPFRANCQVGTRAKASDYEPTAEALVLRAIRDYEAHVLGKNFFPDPTLHAQWAEAAFRSACSIAQVQHSSDKRVIKLVCGCTLNAHDSYIASTD